MRNLKNIAVVTLSILGFSSFAANIAWNYESGNGLSAENPALWSDAANWVGETVPGAQDTALFASGTDANLSRYVLFDGVYNGESLTCSGKSVSYFIFDKIDLSSRQTSQIKFTNDSKKSIVFGDWDVGDTSRGFAYGKYAGKMTTGPDGQYTGLAGNAYFRYDMASLAEGGVENIDLGTIGNIMCGSSSILIAGPKRAAASTSDGWKMKKGSKFIVSSGTTVLNDYTPGQIVTGENIPEGTYIRYLISNKVMMLSNAATLDNENAELSFSALNPVVKQKVKKFYLSANQGTGIFLYSYVNGNPFRLEIDTVDINHNAALGGYKKDYNIPLTGGSLNSGIFVLKNVITKNSSIILNGDTHIEFARPDSGTPGILSANSVYLHNPDNAARTVTFSTIEGIDATVNNLSNSVGTVVKTGLGTLTTTSLYYDKGVSVKEGEWIFNPTANCSSYSFSNLSILNGATFTVGDNVTLDVRGGTLKSGAVLKIGKNSLVTFSSNVVCEKGVTITGEGKLVLENSSSIKDVNMSGVSISFVNQSNIQATQDFLLNNDNSSGMDVSMETDLASAVDLDVDGDINVDIEEASSLVALGVKGDGAIVKKGSGTMLIKDINSESVDVKVLEGTMKIRSLNIAKNNLPLDQFLHVDADDNATVTMKNEYLNKITDSRGGQVSLLRAASGSTSTYPSLVPEETLGGRKVIDFGPLLYSSIAWKGNRISMKFVKGSTDTPSKALRTYIAVWGFEYGGGHLLGGNNGRNDSPYGLVRGDKTTGAAVEAGIDYTYPLFAQKSEAGVQPTGLRNKNNVIVRRNSEVIDPFTMGFSGRDSKFDIISISSAVNFEGSNFSQMHYAQNSCGMKIGEVLLYERRLPNETVKAIEAYLNKKWFNAETKEFRPAVFKDLFVAKDSSLDIEGNHPITVESLSGAGTVNGDVAFNGNGKIFVNIDNEGNLDTNLKVNGNVDISKNGSVVISGNIGKLVAGSYPILSSSSILTEAAGEWNCTSPATSKHLRVSISDGVMSLNVSDGFIILLR